MHQQAMVTIVAPIPLARVPALAQEIGERLGNPAGDAFHADVERDAGSLTGDLASDDHSGDGRLTALARAVWRMGRSLFALHDELGRRPQGRRFWRAIANLPVVGAVGAYKAERSGLRRAARRAAAWVAREHG